MAAAGVGNVTDVTDISSSPSGWLPLTSRIRSSGDVADVTCVTDVTAGVVAGTVGGVTDVTDGAAGVTGEVVTGVADVLSMPTILAFDSKVKSGSSESSSVVAPLDSRIKSRGS